MIRAATAAFIGLIGAAHADDALRLRVETAMGIDTNITRSEGTAPKSGPVARAVLDVAQSLKLKGTQLAVNYQAGGRAFLDNTEEDGLFQRLTGQTLTRVARRLIVGINGQVQNRTTRDPLQSRDHTRVGAGPMLATRLGPVGLTVNGQAGRLIFKPDDDFSANALTGSVTANWRSGRWVITGRGGATQRSFDGNLRERNGTAPGGDPLIGLGTTRRSDTTFSGGLGLRFRGERLFRLEYAVAANQSNSYGGSFVRHLLRGSMTTALPLNFALSARFDVQRVVYDEPQFIARFDFIEDESRSSAVVRLERPLVDPLSLVVQAGTWFSPFGDGPAYSRQTMLFGLAANLDR
jgi:hypothetical protein